MEQLAAAISNVQLRAQSSSTRSSLKSVANSSPRRVSSSRQMPLLEAVAEREQQLKLMEEERARHAMEMAAGAQKMEAEAARYCSCMLQSQSVG